MGATGSTWQAGGYCGKGNVGELLGSLAGRSAVVCGNADGVFGELHYAKAVLGEPVIFAVNDVGVYLDRLDHWVTLHWKHFAAWKAARFVHHNAPDNVKYHSVAKDADVDYAWEAITPVTGSGLP